MSTSTRRPRDPELHDREERLPARERLRVRARPARSSASSSVDARTYRTGAGITPLPRAAPAARIDSTIGWYPVQRQKLPRSARRIASSSGSGSRESRSTAVRIIPGVQNPHWSPWCSTNASLDRDGARRLAARPSIVVTSAPSAWSASMVQLFTARPSRSTVQAPHWLVSQPTCVPVSPSPSRSAWTRSVRGSTSSDRGSPLTTARP